MPQTCLIIDDSLTIRRGLKLALEKAQLFDEILEARDGADALEILSPADGTRGPAVDLVLCDLVMPGVDGWTFLEKFKADEANLEVPVIVLTGQETVDKKVRALDEGASDYLTKPFDPAELVARVRVHLKLKALQDQLREANVSLEALAVHDPLTGLYNRRYFIERLEVELDRSRRHSNALALLLLDLDKFRLVNEAQGHAVGDKALFAVADTLRRSLRRHDLVCRFAGAQFAVMLPQTGRAEGAAVGEKLRLAVSQDAYAAAGNVPLTASVGVATFPDADMVSIDDMLARADDAVTRAKEMGRDRVVMWLGELGQAAAVAIRI